MSWALSRKNVLGTEKHAPETVISGPWRTAITCAVRSTQTAHGVQGLSNGKRSVVVTRRVSQRSTNFWHRMEDCHKLVGRSREMLCQTDQELSFISSVPRMSTTFSRSKSPLAPSAYLPVPKSDLQNLISAAPLQVETVALREQVGISCVPQLFATSASVA